MSSADASPFKVGDNGSSGMVLGQIPNLDTLEMDAKLEEADRGQIGVKQDVIVRVDALPELTIPARVSEVSALAELSMDYPYTRSFRASAAILKPDTRLRPGHERRHGHRRQSDPERHQHSFQGAVHAAPESRSSTWPGTGPTAPWKSKCWRATPTRWPSPACRPVRRWRWWMCEKEQKK